MYIENTDENIEDKMVLCFTLMTLKKFILLSPKSLE